MNDTVIGICRHCRGDLVLQQRFEAPSHPRLKLNPFDQALRVFYLACVDCGHAEKARAA